MTMANGRLQMTLTNATRRLNAMMPSSPAVIPITVRRPMLRNCVLPATMIKRAARQSWQRRRRVREVLQHDTRDAPAHHRTAPRTQACQAPLSRDIEAVLFPHRSRRVGLEVVEQRRCTGVIAASYECGRIHDRRIAVGGKRIDDL